MLFSAGDVQAAPGDSAPVRQSTATDRSGYKPHVDGLRAVSIAAVLGFHAGNIPFLRGGFVGVDVFFVISGFLIIKQIAAGIEQGRFSIWDFYARRALRIVPTYFLVLLVTVVVGAVLLRSPDNLANFRSSATAASLFFTNFFYLKHSGYFDVGASGRPLLHTWSLSVEEQFYLVAPLTLMLVFWLVQRRGWSKTTVLAVAAAAIALPSLAGAIFLTPSDSNPLAPDPNPAFFLTQWRAWQFVAGGFVALAVPVHLRGANFIGTMAGLVGAAAIALSISFVGLEWLGVRVGFSDRISGYPGIAAILPTVGAVLVIGSGLVAPASPIARLLSLAPMTFVGRISYALYLWHWPLLVFGRLLPLDASPAAVSMAALSAAFLLSIATYYAIELPIASWPLRARLRVDPRFAFRVILVGIGFCVFMAVASNLFVQHSLVLARANPILARTASAVVSNTQPCLRADPRTVDGCFDGAAPVGILIGDSHAFAIEPRVAHGAEAAGVRLISLATMGCSPLAVMASRAAAEKSPYCTPMLDKLDRLKSRFDSGLDYVIISILWTAIIRDQEINHSGGGEAKLARLFDALLTRFESTKRILVLGPVPQFVRADPFNCVSLSLALGLSSDRCAMPRAKVEADRAKTVAVMKAVIAKHPNARFADVIDVFCDERFCSPLHDGAIDYADFSHLNQYGAMLLFDGLKPDFEWAFHG